MSRSAASVARRVAAQRSNSIDGSLSALATTEPNWHQVERLNAAVLGLDAGSLVTRMGMRACFSPPCAHQADCSDLTPANPSSGRSADAHLGTITTSEQSAVGAPEAQTRRGTAVAPERCARTRAPNNGSPSAASTPERQVGTPPRARRRPPAACSRERRNGAFRMTRRAAIGALEDAWYRTATLWSTAVSGSARGPFPGAAVPGLGLLAVLGAAMVTIAAVLIVHQFVAGSAVELSVTLAFAAIAFTLIAIPGPDWAYVVAAGAHDRVVAPAVAGILSCYGIVTAVVVAGVGNSRHHRAVRPDRDDRRRRRYLTHLADRGSEALTKHRRRVERLRTQRQRSQSKSDAAFDAASA